MKKGEKMSEEHKAKLMAGRKAKLADKAMADPNPKVEPRPEVMKVPEGVKLPEHQAAMQNEEVKDTPETQSMFETVKKLEAQIEALTAQVQAQTPVERLNSVANMTNAIVTNSGVQGQVFKYPVEQSYYPDPTDRLYDDPKLKRYALRENFYFKWEVTGVAYEKNGITYNEPRFMVELWKFIFDDETGEPTGEMFLVNRQIQHEDELAARMAAGKLGYKIGPNEKFQTLEEMMDEMRYYRIRMWLLDVFTPYRAHQHKARKSLQRVIGGRVVEVTDTEKVIDANSGINTADTINDAIQLTPAEVREAQRAGLL